MIPGSPSRFRSFPYLIVAFTLVLALALCWAGEAQSAPIMPERAELQATARSQGRVRVLVKFVAPGYPERLAASRTFHTGRRRGLERVAAARQADLLLAQTLGSAADAVLAGLPASGRRELRRFATLPLAAMELDEQGLAALEGLPGVEAIFLDRSLSLPPLPEPKPESVLDGLLQPYLDATVGIIGADDAWTSGYTGQGWYVAILDSGIRTSHEFFQGKDIVEACFASHQDGSGDCPNGGTSDFGPGSAAHHPDTYPGWDHGTHVAGIATGSLANGTLHGVAPDADIIAVNVFSIPDTVGAKVTAYVSDLLTGLEYVYFLRSSYAISAVNMSLGGGAFNSQSACDTYIPEVKAAIDNLRAVGIASIISSGNDGYCTDLGWPGCLSSAVSVGAVSDDDVEASFSNWQADLLDLFAPGESIYSSTGDADNTYEYWSGTSMAAPHVTGAWTLLRQHSPDATVDQILAAVLNTGPLVATKCGTGLTKRRLQVDDALDIVCSAPPGTPASISYPSSDDDGAFTVSWAAVSGALGYTLQHAGNASFSDAATVYEGGNSSFGVSGAAHGTHYYRVRADNACGGGGWRNGDAIVVTLPCAYVIDPTSDTAAYAGGSGTVGVSAAAYCDWTAVSNDAGWLHVTAGSSGSGDGSVSWSADANAVHSERSGSITIAGETFTVTLAAAPCSYGIAPTSDTAAYGGGSGSVSVTATTACAWTAVSNDSGWLHVTAGSSGSGDGSVSWSADANAVHSERSGSITIAGETFTVTQAAAPCAYGIAPTSDTAAYSGGSGSVTVTATTACAWTAISNDTGWLHVTAGASGSGDGSVSWSADANAVHSERSGSITIAGETFTVTQAAAPCSYGIAPTSDTAAYSGGSGSVTVTATTGCAWTAVSNDSGWLHVTAGASGSGDGSVSWSADANAVHSERSGSITIAGETFTVTQAAAPCSYGIAPTSDTAAYSGGSGSVSVTATSGCAWTAFSNDTGWLHVTAGASGSGDGSVSWSADANAVHTERSGSITIAGETFTVTQAAASCAYGIAPTSDTAAYSGGSGSVSVTATTACAWTAISNDTGWLHVTAGSSGSGDGSVSWSADANAGLPRVGTVAIAGKVLTISQGDIPGVGDMTGPFMLLLRPE